MVEPSPKKIAAAVDQGLTGDEATQYDRQIRLWGVEAQRRLGAAKVLVIGATGLSAELCKNLVLAGVASLTLCDNGITTAEDLTAQFLLNVDDVGHSRALRAVPGISLLNPGVVVTADLDAIGTKTMSYYRQFDLVCMTTGNPDEQAAVNDHCRVANVKFCGARSFGYLGYVFVDFIEHTFVDEVPMPAVPAKEGAPATEAFTKKSTNCAKFVSFRRVLESAYPKLRSSRTSPVFFQLLVWHAFYTAQGRAPTSTAADVELLLAARTAACLRAQLPASAIPDALALDLAASLACEVAPVSAILGGVLTNEAVKGLSGKDKPQNNCLFFEGHTSVGMLHTFPADGN